MNNTMIPTPEKPDGKSLSQNNALHASQVVLGLGLVMIVYGVYSLTRNPDTARMIFMALYLLLAVAGGVAMRLIHRQKADLGGFVLVGANLIVLLVVGVFLKGLGIILGMLSLLLVGVIAFQALTARHRLTAIFASIVAAVFIIGFDQVSTAAWRREALLSPSATAIMAIFIVLGYFSIILSQFRTFTLRTKLVAAFLAVTIIPLVIISYITYTASQTALTNAANEKLQAAAQQVALELDEFIQINLQNVRAAGQYPAIEEYLSLPASMRRGSPEETRATTLLSAISRQEPVFISSVAVFDVNGITLLDTFAADIGTDKANRTYFADTIATGLPTVSDVEHSSTTGVASIYFAAPVRDANGKVTGVLRIRYAASILQRYITQHSGDAGETSYALLLSPNNVRLAHGLDRERVFKSLTPLDPIVLRDLQAKGLMPAGTAEELSTNFTDFSEKINNVAQEPYFSSETDGDGALEQVASTLMVNKPWRVVFIQDQTVFLTPITAQTTRNLLAALIIAGVVGVAGFFFSQTLSGPLVRLTQVAEAIASGDINIQAKVETEDEIGTLANTFNRMTQQLRDFIIGLEERVSARTKDLATVAEVGTATSTILETIPLLKAVVELTKERFNLYHSHIYLLDEKGENLVLTAGAGEPGRIMAAEKRSIPVSREQSLVARAARERKGITVNDVTQAPDFLPNPLLPNTRSELAVPMLVGETLVGVFDIQSDMVGRFTESDINIQTTLAAQLASSVQNARSYERSKAQADFETMVNTINQKIQRANSVEETLQTAVRELGLALGARAVVNLAAQRDVNEN